MTPDAKRVLLDRLLRAWEQNPGLRFGELLSNALRDTGHEGVVGTLLPHVEDEHLARIVERLGTVTLGSKR